MLKRALLVVLAAPSRTAVSVIELLLEMDAAADGQAIPGAVLFEGGGHLGVKPVDCSP